MRRSPVSCSSAITTRALILLHSAITGTNTSMSRATIFSRSWRATSACYYLRVWQDQGARGDGRRTRDGDAASDRPTAATRSSDHNYRRFRHGGRRHGVAKARQRIFTLIERQGARRCGFRERWPRLEVISGTLPTRAASGDRGTRWGDAPRAPRALSAPGFKPLSPCPRRGAKPRSSRFTPLGVRNASSSGGTAISGAHATNRLRSAALHPYGGRGGARGCGGGGRRPNNRLFAFDVLAAWPADRPCRRMAANDVC